MLETEHKEILDEQIQAIVARIKTERKTPHVGQAEIDLTHLLMEVMAFRCAGKIEMV